MYIIPNNSTFSTLQSPLTNSDTTMTLVSGAGPAAVGAPGWPAIASPDYTYATILAVDGSGVYEIVKITAHAANAPGFTIARAQEGTTAVAWAAGSRVEWRLNYSGLAELAAPRRLLQKAAAAITAASTLPIDSVSGSFVVDGSSTITAIPARPDGDVIRLRFSGTGGTPVLQNGASLILAGGINYVPRVNEFIELESQGGGTWIEMTRTARQGNPVGTVVYHSGTSAPDHHIIADGGLKNRADYPYLWAHAQASGNLAASDGVWTPGQFSPGNGTTTFRIPNLQGPFIRGHHNGDGTYESDTGRAFGSYKDSQNKAHHHLMPCGGSPVANVLGGTGSYYVPQNYPANTGDDGGVEAYPRNITLLGCIKYQ